MKLFQKWYVFISFFPLVCSICMKRIKRNNAAKYCLLLCLSTFNPFTNELKNRALLAGKSNIPLLRRKAWSYLAFTFFSRIKSRIDPMQENKAQFLQNKNKQKQKHTHKTHPHHWCELGGSEDWLLLVSYVERRLKLGDAGVHVDQLSRILPRAGQVLISSLTCIRLTDLQQQLLGIAKTFFIIFALKCLGSI